LESIFPSHGLIELDIGCGKGHFMVARATAHPELNFIGIDRQMKRIRRADRKILNAKLSNARLLRAEAFYTLSFMLPPESVSRVHIFFPDPWPKRRHHTRRLFSQPFMEALHRVLITGGQLNLATDDRPYFDAITALLGRDTRFESVPVFVPAPHERTCFEVLFLEKGVPINRVSIRKV
jgi:tRNA (guanine-N7-)-methyltransferase